MNWTVTIRPKAKADLRRAHDWYEERCLGLGDEFLADHAEALLRLEADPERLLRWCLQYAGESTGPTEAVFGVVKQRFAGVPSETYKLVSDINTFRNDYIAHQNKELTDAVIAADALGEWVSGLCRIWRFYG